MQDIQQQQMFSYIFTYDAYQIQLLKIGYSLWVVYIIARIRHFI